MPDVGKFNTDKKLNNDPDFLSKWLKNFVCCIQSLQSKVCASLFFKCGVFIDIEGG